MVNDAAKELANSIFVVVNTTMTVVHDVWHAVPGGSFIWSYIKRSHQNDPFRTLLEVVVLIFMGWYVLRKKNRAPGQPQKLDLKPHEIQELIDEWEPEPLVPPPDDAAKWELDHIPVLLASQGLRTKLIDGKQVANFASYNFLGLLNHETIKEKAIEALHTYGVGTCGPPGFYGTLDVHMELENALAAYVGREHAIIYSQGFSTISSVIPAFSKRGDILVVDNGVSFAIQQGVILSRSRVYWFQHNDTADLERVLRDIAREESSPKNRKRLLPRKFIVTEGLFCNSGDVAPLPAICDLSDAYKYRLILDESFSFGVLGARGRGAAEFWDLDPSRVDIMVGSLCNALAASGGFCAGSREIVEHQRLSGLSYTFSASLPSLLAVSALEALRILDHQPELLTTLQQNIAAVHAVLAKPLEGVTLETEAAAGDNVSPIIHVRLREDVYDVEESEVILQDAVDAAIREGYVFTRAKYIRSQEIKPPHPSIRLTVSAGFTKKECERAATVLRDALRKSLKTKK
ncbi:hypothetical protein CXG81DRAFT_14917 [Caulochytrium protostelioides]|uniref:serine C-palmitoyltransferase n=1 Tax=Caulochytrium protostelioides TaxID=1555241 RepID=A0A4P9X253_9FUNG|nr:hypothetical protein CXG81DRAFT_14917 [Caulochytrium protostelioides]|eukprot:RKO99153.1 hypothetical protein CXG81DRAFT_14917 [Caulochytrium protostelioides]